MITKKKSVFVLLSLMLILSDCVSRSETTTEEVAEPVNGNETLESPGTPARNASTRAVKARKVRSRSGALGDRYGMNSA